MEYKIQTVKLAKEIDGVKAADELGIPKNTMYVWRKIQGKGGWIPVPIYTRHRW